MSDHPTGGHGFEGRYQFASAMGTETITACYAQCAAYDSDFDKRPANGTHVGPFDVSLSRRVPHYDVATLRWHWPSGAIVALGFKISRS